MKDIKELLNFSILNIDKPQGPTSFAITDYLRKSLNLNRCSHQGTLDPAVSGVLPILLGRACRLSEYFMHKNKTYVGIMRLHKEVEEKELKETIKKFIGKINQLPPVRSSVKRAIRQREIFSFNILEIDGKDVLFETEVQAGTYIRKLCDDIGKEIGGAHMLELRRTKAGIFTEEDKNFINLYQFEEALKDEDKLRSLLIPAEKAIKSVLPHQQISPTQTQLKQLLTGKPLHKSDFPQLPKEDKFALFTKEQLIGIYKRVNEGDIIAKAEFVYN